MGAGHVSGAAGGPAVQAGFRRADRPDDVWLLGATFDSATGLGGSFLDHWNGRDWAPVSLPRLGKWRSLDVIDARGPSDVWVAGTNYAGDVVEPAQPEQLILLHWNGRSWHQASQPSTRLWTQRVTGLRMLSADSVWVTGWGKVAPDFDQPRYPLALHWNGTSWRATPVPGPGELYQLGPDGHDLWAVGDTFYPVAPSYTADFLRWTGTKWVNAPVPVQGEASLFGEAAVPGGGLWAVGATGTANAPVIALWD